MSITSFRVLVFNAKSIAHKHRTKKKLLLLPAKKSEAKESEKKTKKEIIKAYVNERMFSLWEIVFLRV